MVRFFFSFKTQSGRENFIEKSFLVEKGAFINRRKVSRIKNTIMDEPFEESARKTKTEIPYKYIATIHKTNEHSDEILSVEISEITLRDETACDKNTLQAVHYYSPCVNFQFTKRCQTVVRPYYLYVPVYNVIDTEILLYLRVERLFQVTKEVLNKVYSGEIL